MSDYLETEAIPVLKDANEKLASLLSEPEPGLATWLIAVATQVRRMAEITGEVR